jgi:hypothetical protein
MGTLAHHQQWIAGAAIKAKRLFGKLPQALITTFACRSKDEILHFAVSRFDADGLAFAVQQPNGFNVVDRRSTQVLKCAQQRDREASVVKLAVVIENAAAQAIRGTPASISSVLLTRQQL